MTDKNRAMIFDIKHYAIHDGPGIRTTVFFKGCPLRCQWCANPESQAPLAQIMFAPGVCQSCRTCEAACPNNAIQFKDGRRLYNRSACSGCGQCAQICPFDAVQLCGYKIDMTSLWNQIKDDRAFWDRSGGGVTLSGGDPLVQYEFAQKFLSHCAAHKVHTAIETCGHVSQDIFESVLDVTDLVIFDFKLADEKQHKTSVGRRNHQIKINLARLLESDKQALVRMPLIPGCNDRPEQIRQLCSFVEQARKGVDFEILPYHSLGEQKYLRLGRPYSLTGLTPPAPDRIKEIKQLVSEFDLNFKISTDFNQEPDVCSPPEETLMTRLYQTNPSQCFYGHSIGILILDVMYPCVPGNVNNATTFNFPVRYKVVKNATSGKLIYNRDKRMIQPFIDAAKELQDEGVAAITGACGFMALFQQEVARELDIPVFLSSLLQIPFIDQILGRKKQIGVIAADATALTDDFFRGVGIRDTSRLAVAGMEDKTEFVGAILKRKGSLDSELIQEEVLDVVGKLTKQTHDLGAILLECSDLPPYAQVIQNEVNLPVFDYVSMIDHVHSALVKRPYAGHL